MSVPTPAAPSPNSAGPPTPPHPAAKPFYSPPTAPPLDSAALDYYGSLAMERAEGNVAVGHMGARRGKGLVALRAAEAGELLLAERPLLALQHSENRRWMRACEHCLRSVGTVREQWLRLLEERRRRRLRRLRRQQADTNGHAHDHDDEDDDDEEEDDEEDEEEDEDEDEDDEEQREDDEKADAPYTLPDPLPFTSPSSSPRFNIERYDVTPLSCTHCDDEYCSVECRDAAWRQHHSLLCPHASFSGVGAGKDAKDKGEASAAVEDDSKLHPVQRLYKFADENNEIFRLVAKLIATVISSHIAADPSCATPPSLFPFSLFASSIWWQQVVPPPDLSPVSASRFQSRLQSMCAEARQLLQPVFPAHSQPASPFAFLFSLPLLGRLVSIFESNQLSLFAPSPVDTYIAFVLGLGAEEVAGFRRAVGGGVYRATNGVVARRVEGVGLFSLLCCMNHSCEPNCRLVKRDHEREADGFVDLDCTMAAMATRHIADAEELTINYVEDSDTAAPDTSSGGTGSGERMTWRERAVALLDYGIVCDCERCEEEKRREEEGVDGNSEDEEELQQFEDDDNGEDEEDADAEDDDNEDDA